MRGVSRHRAPNMSISGGRRDSAAPVYMSAAPGIFFHKSTLKMYQSKQTRLCTIDRRYDEKIFGTSGFSCNANFRDIAANISAKMFADLFCVNECARRIILVAIDLSMLRLSFSIEK